MLFREEGEPNALPRPYGANFFLAIQFHITTFSSAAPFLQHTFFLGPRDSPVGMAAEQFERLITDTIDFQKRCYI